MERPRASIIIVMAAAATFVAAAVVGTRGAGTELTVRGRSNANPSMASSGRFVAITWGASAKQGEVDIFTAVSRDAGRTFGTPTRVSDSRTQAALSGEQPPRVSLVRRAGQDPSLVVVWTARAAAGTRLLSARSDDGGRSFAPPILLPGSEAPGNRGWEATATDRDGRVVAIWLDHRELARAEAGAAPTDHLEHQHGASSAQQTDGVARAQMSKLFFARLDSAGSARAIAGGVCYCCRTTVATGADGAVHAAWRHVYPGNVRDIAFTVSRDGGRTFAAPIRVSEDRWVLDGCPENGPAMAVGDDGRIHVVWPTLIAGATAGSEPTLALFYAMSRDGRRFTPRQRIPTEGFPRHPQIALGARGDVVVAWDEQSDAGRRVAWGRGTVDDKAALRFARQTIGGDVSASYPVVASTEEGVVIAWTSGSGQTVLRTERLTN